MLAAYAHVARCPSCASYAADYLPTYSAHEVVIAVLAHHDSGHLHDPLDAAGQLFATF